MTKPQPEEKEEKNGSLKLGLSIPPAVLKVILPVLSAAIVYAGYETGLIPSQSSKVAPPAHQVQAESRSRDTTSVELRNWQFNILKGNIDSVLNRQRRNDSIRAANAEWQKAIDARLTRIENALFVPYRPGGSP